MIEQSNLQHKFFSTLEALRGLAAILVMVRHITYIYPIQFPWSYLAVDLFFVLSGAVIANSYEQKLLSGKMRFSEFAALRLIRIFPLYLLGSAISIFAMVVDGNVATGKIIVFAVLALVMIPLPMPGPPLFPLNFPAWSLMFEFIANFIYAKFARRLTDRALLVIIGFSFVFLFIGAIVSGVALDIGWGRKTLIFGFPRVFFSFFIGVLIYRYAVRKNRINISLGPGSALAILAASVFVQTAPIGETFAPYYCMLVVSVIFPVIVCLSMFVNVSGRLEKGMRLLGEASFPVYALHWPLFLMSESLGRRFLEQNAPYSGILFAGAVILISFLIHSWIDVPLRRFLKSLLLVSESSFRKQFVVLSFWRRV